ncbi:MAG: protein-glutamate O-methyltransferase CheR [Planctomycetota bacterium]
MSTLPFTEIDEKDFSRFQDYIYRAAGIRVGNHKRTLVSNRVRKRLRATGHSDFATYFRYLTSPKGVDEIPFFLDEITTNETYFFRDVHQYEWFGSEYVRELVNLARQGKRRRNLNVWSAACSTGAEPYSIALKIQEAIPATDDWTIRILATDLSGSVLEAAKEGVYDARSLQLVSPNQRRRFFRQRKGEERWEIHEGAKKLVEFRRHNLLSPVAGGPFDCIFIKNVLIYFDDQSKTTVVKNLLSSLTPGGYLVVGPAEGIFRMLDPLERVNAWLYRKPAK